MNKTMFMGIFFSAMTALCCAETKSYFSSLGAFDLAYYEKPKRYKLAIAGTVTAATALAVRSRIGEWLPKIVFKNVDPLDFAETTAAIGGLAALSAGFEHGVSSFADTLPRVGKLFLMHQIRKPNEIERHELMKILGSGIGLSFLCSVSEWLKKSMSDE